MAEHHCSQVSVMAQCAYLFVLDLKHAFPNHLTLVFITCTNDHPTACEIASTQLVFCLRTKTCFSTVNALLAAAFGVKATSA